MELILVLVLAVLCIGFGLLAGLAIGSLGKSKSTPARGTGSHEPEPARRFGLVELARLWSDRDGTRFVLEMNGRFYKTPETLAPDHRMRLNAILDRMRTWIGIQESFAGLSPNPNPPAESQLAVSPPPHPVAPAVLQMPAVQPEKPGMVSLLARALQPESHLVSPDKSIATQIDEILQDKLEGSPLEKRGIRLMELPGKGMVVMVGFDQYPGVSDVPDLEIQAVIREAVAEWEKRISSRSD